MTDVPAQLTAAVAAWEGPSLDLGGPPRSPLFSELVEICVQAFPEAAGIAGKAGAPNTGV
jgi:hypothetical protein